MRRIFLDTNFIIDLLVRDEYKEEASNFLAEGARRGFKFHISFLTVANFAYVARKLPMNELHHLIDMISSLFVIVPNNAEQIKQAIALGANDFEDALQYQSALDSQCECIITRNEKDFRFSKIPVHSAENYTKKYFA